MYSRSNNSAVTQRALVLVRRTTQDGQFPVRAGAIAYRLSAEFPDMQLSELNEEVERAAISLGFAVELSSRESDSVGSGPAKPDGSS